LVHTGFTGITRTIYASKQHLLPEYPTKKAPSQRLIENISVLENENSELSSYLGHKLRATRMLAPEQWETLKNNIIGFPIGTGKSFVSRGTVDFVLLKEICKQENVSLAKSFCDIQKNEMPLLWKECILNLFSQANIEQVKVVEDFVINFARDILKNNDLKKKMYWQALKVLAKTNVWREVAKHYLTNMKDVSDNNNNFLVGSGVEKRRVENLYSVNAVVPFVLRSLKEKDFSLMWQLLYGELFNQKFNVLKDDIPENIASCYEEVNCEWIKHCKVVMKDKGEEVAELEMEKLFKYLRSVGRYAGKETQAALLDYYKYSGTRTAKVAKVREGSCVYCKTEMERRNISQEDMNILKKAILEFVIKKKDIYLNTNPRELQSFLQLLEKGNEKPYDVVVDGQNVSYHRIPNHLKSLKNVSRHLLETVEYFTGRGYRVLVIDRDRIKEYNNNKLYKGLCKISTVVTLGKVTQDDPYMILAALHSGQGCRIVTNDYLRQHCYLLAKESPALAKLFTEWQLSHQIRISEFSGYKDVLTKHEVTRADPQFIWPITHSLSAQHDQEHTWHIPIMSKETLHGLNTTNNFLCIGPADRIKIDA